MLLFPAGNRGCVAFSYFLRDIRCRSDGNEHLPAVLREQDIARDVAALDAAPARVGKAAHDHLRFSARFEKRAVFICWGWRWQKQDVKIKCF
jgi:hypothetical protein